MTKTVDRGPIRLSRRQRRALARASGAALTLGMGFGLGAPAEAATFTVTNLNDSGAGSLRQAIADAQSAAGPDVITFQAGLTGTITLTTGHLRVSDSVSIQGPGQAVVAVNANHASRVFYLYSNFLLSTPSNITISGLTLTGGVQLLGGCIFVSRHNLVLDHVTVDANAATSKGGGLFLEGHGNSLTIMNSVFSGNTAGNAGGAMLLYSSGQPILIQDSVISGNQSTGGTGGGISLYKPDADMTIERSTLSGNTASGAGGGLFVYNPQTAGVTLRQSTISGNSASQGGGAYFYNLSGPLVIENSTVSGNQVTGAGGGLFFYHGPPAGSGLHSSTIASNTAGSNGGGIYLYTGSLPLENTIVAGNTAGTDDDISNGKGGNFVLDHDLVQDTGGASFTDNGGNIFNQSPQLSALGNHGGPTQTMLPAATSPVIDAGSAASPAVDQRGVARPAGAGFDIGAVEVAPAQPIAQVPALGDAGKLLLAGLMGAAGFLLLRRRSDPAAEPPSSP